MHEDLSGVYIPSIEAIEVLELVLVIYSYVKNHFKLSG